MYIQRSLKDHRITGTQSRMIAKVQDPRIYNFINFIILNRSNAIIRTQTIPCVVVELFAPGRICSLLEVEKILSSGPVSCLAPALRFLLLQLYK